MAKKKSCVIGKKKFVVFSSTPCEDDNFSILKRGSVYNDVTVAIHTNKRARGKDTYSDVILASQRIPAKEWNKQRPSLIDVSLPCLFKEDTKYWLVVTTELSTKVLI